MWDDENLWNQAFDTLHGAIGSVDETTLTLDQRLKIAEVKALLSIAQELSGLRHGGINPEYQA